MVVVAAVPSEGKLYTGDGKMGNSAAVTLQHWKQCVGELQLQVTPDVFEMYIQPLRLVEGPGCTVVAPNQYVKEWIDLRLGRAVTKTLRHMIGEPVELTVRVSDGREMAQQMALGRNEAGGVTAIQVGELRAAGFVPLWHDLRNLYGPRIGLDGVGLWAELRAMVHGANDGHPLAGYAWPGMRGIADGYGVGRRKVSSVLDVLRDVALVDWSTGRELMELFDLEGEQGIPLSQRNGMSADVLRRLLDNADASRLYQVNDPLELPEFCARFGYRLVLVDGAVTFDNYAGRLSGRWQAWVARLMEAQGVESFSSDAWVSMGLSRSF